MDSFRRPSTSERRLIEALVQRSNLALPPEWKNTLSVETMDDGEMGGLLLFPDGCEQEERVFGGVASRIEFKDQDGTDVLVTLNLDKDGKLFEIDSWKVDFSPLIRIPDDL
ncbi:MAG: hypothetical protein WKF34_12405 [Pyrinomonadaceae bacterium]